MAANDSFPNIQIWALSIASVASVKKNLLKIKDTSCIDDTVMSNPVFLRRLKLLNKMIGPTFKMHEAVIFISTQGLSSIDLTWR